MKKSKTYTLFFCICSLPLPLSAAEPYFQEAEIEFAKKNYAAAKQLYSEQRDSLRNKEMQKEQRDSLWLSAGEQIVRCLTAMNDNEQAAEEYFLLCRVEPLMSLDAVPLPWFIPLELKSGTKPRETTADNILDRLKTPQSKIESPGAILLAAGILSVSNNPLKQQGGKQRLRQLADSLETELNPKEKSNLLYQRQQEAALLARVMLWKEQIPLLKTADDLIPLKRLLHKISEPQRAGAYFLLGNAARQTGQSEEAVLLWMRIPILYGYNRPLAAEALRETIIELKKLGRNEQAETLLKEISN
jgi:hypothetical protein